MAQATETVTEASQSALQPHVSCPLRFHGPSHMTKGNMKGAKKCSLNARETTNSFGQGYPEGMGRKLGKAKELGKTTQCMSDNFGKYNHRGLQPLKFYAFS